MKFSNYFKNTLFLLMVICASSLFIIEAKAQENLDDMLMLYELQRYIYVENNIIKARKVASELISRVANTNEIHKIITPLIQKISAVSKEPDESIHYATGVKDEIYCKNVGLVYLQAQHNNETTSEVHLINSNRELNGSYSIVLSGDWVYELITSYRKPIRSESWIVKGTPKSYSISEVRQNKNGDFDEGIWKTSWDSDGAYSLETKLKGETEEPTPMHMANSYNNWGTYDMGFKIHFKVGYKDSISGRCNGLISTIQQKTQRSVDEWLNQFNYTDSSGKKHTYSDCFKVHSIIELDKLEPSKEKIGHNIE